MERSGVSQEIMNQNNNHSRVNFYDPSTIMNYGSDILKKIDELKDNYSTMDDDYEIDANMQEKIKKIDFFKEIMYNEREMKSDGKEGILYVGKKRTRGANSEEDAAKGSQKEEKRRSVCRLAKSEIQSGYRH